MAGSFGDPALPILDDVSLAGGGAARLPVLVHRQVQPLAGPAHPADLPRGNPRHQCETLNVAGDDRAGADERIASDGGAAHDRAVRSERCASTHSGRPVFALPLDCRPRIDDVGEDHARSTEHVLVKDDAVVDRHVVLDLAAVADEGAVPHEDVLAKHDVPADFRSAANMDEMPDSRVLSNLRSVIDDRGFVAVITHPAAALLAAGCESMLAGTGWFDRIAATVSIAGRAS